MKKKNTKDKIYNLLLVVFIALFIISAGLLISDLIPRFQANNEMKDIQEEVFGDAERTHSENDKEVEYDPMLALENINFDNLENINSDIVGWIIIPNTNINYPILQGTNNDYYLNHTYKETYNDAGSIYLDMHNARDFSDQNTTIYGHARLDGTMFKQLHKYKKQKGYTESPKILIATKDGVSTYNIASSTIVENTYNFTQTEYNDLVDHVERLKSSSRVYSKTTVDENSKIITLSTCTDIIQDGRLIVVGVLEE